PAAQPAKLRIETLVDAVAAALARANGAQVDGARHELAAGGRAGPEQRILGAHQLWAAGAALDMIIDPQRASGGRVPGEEQHQQEHNCGRQSVERPSGSTCETKSLP